MPIFGLFKKGEAADSAVPEHPVAHAVPTPDDLPRGNETVLVAEDEALILENMAFMLAELGYRVVQAADGEQALRICLGKGAQKIDLVIADILMPNMTGKRLAYRLGQVCPQTKVILCSGCPERLATRTGMIDVSIPFLKKPVSARDLALKVREVLDGPTAESDWQERLKEKDCSDAEFTAGMAGGAITPSLVSHFTDYQV